MNLIQTNSLSARQAEQILALLNECQKTQPIHISFPFEDGNCFLLLLDESETLAAIMGMLLPPDGSSDEEPVECIAFTRPSLRRRGYFAALLEKACDISGMFSISLRIFGSNDTVPLRPLMFSIALRIASIIRNENSDDPII